MSNIKSYQRLIAVQAIYELSINKKSTNINLKDIFNHIIENSDYKKKLDYSNLLLAEEIYKGVNSNLGKVDLILAKSLRNEKNAQTFDKLLLSIFRSAIFELIFKREISKKVIISEYLLITNHFFGNKEAALLNGVLDNLQEI